MPDDDDLELAPGEPTKSGKTKTIVIITVGVLLAVGLSVGATLYFTGAFSGDESTAEAEQAKGTEAKSKEVKPALYMALEPQFIVNFEDQSQASFLQIETQVMARDQAVLDALQQHMPVVRNNILLLLSGQKYEQVSTTQGKETLRGEIRKAINKVLKKETGSAGVEAIYFTSFIMQ
jgi:flagellar FliL protein